MLLESVFHYLFCLKFAFKLVTFSKSYTRKQKWVFFLNTVYKQIRITDKSWSLLEGHLLPMPAKFDRCPFPRSSVIPFT